MYEAIPRSNHFLSASNTGEFMGKGLRNKTVQAGLNCSLLCGEHPFVLLHE